MSKRHLRVMLIASGIAALSTAGYFIITSRPLPVRVAHIEENVPIRVSGLGTVEARVLSKVGFATGATLIVNIKDYFPRRVVLEPDNVAILAAIVFVVCLLSSALGVRAALKVDPATALGG